MRVYNKSQATRFLCGDQGWDHSNKAFAPYGLPRTAFKPSYGLAEAALFVSTIDPNAAPTVAYLDREQLSAGHAAQLSTDGPDAVAHVSCGRIARSQWAIIVNPDTRAELLDGGAIPRTTSGKLARRACRAQYLNGTLGVK